MFQPHFVLKATAFAAFEMLFYKKDQGSEKRIHSLQNLAATRNFFKNIPKEGKKEIYNIMQGLPGGREGVYPRRIQYYFGHLVIYWSDKNIKRKLINSI